jgi:hypothetical protein
MVASDRSWGAIDVKAPPAVIGPPKQILVVEDEALIAIYLEGLIRELGCICVGPILTLSDAIEQAQTAAVDAAILNLILDGQPAYAVAEILAQRGIPFGFASGVMHASILPEWTERPRVDKPYSLEGVERLIEALLADVKQ